LNPKIADARIPVLPALVVIGSGVAFSAATVLAGMAIRRGASVGTIVLGRLAVGALLLWAVVAVLRIPVRGAGGRALLLFGLGALPATQAYLLYQSVARIPTSVATLLLYTYPAIVTVLVIALRRERINRGKLLALGLSACGLVLVLGLPSERLATAGIVYGLLSAAALAIWIIIADRVTKGVAPILSAALLVAGGAVSYALLSVVTGTGPFDGTSVAWSVPIGAMASLAVLLLLMALQYVPPTTVSIGSTVEPLSTTMLSAWLLGEALGLPQLFGGLLIVAGVIAVVRARSSPSDPGSHSSATGPSDVGSEDEA
jgi:drug/metabolite transporter (DMT)-like permease